MLVDAAGLGRDLLAGDAGSRARGCLQGPARLFLRVREEPGGGFTVLDRCGLWELPGPQARQLSTAVPPAQRNKSRQPGDGCDAGYVPSVSARARFVSVKL